MQSLAIPINERIEKGKIFIPKLIQVGEELANTISMTRYYMNKPSSFNTVYNNSGAIATSTIIENDKSTVGFIFDPRYLVFEFVWNLQLRKKQVEIVNDFRTNLALGNNKHYSLSLIHI